MPDPGMFRVAVPVLVAVLLALGTTGCRGDRERVSTRERGAQPPADRAESSVERVVSRPMPKTPIPSWIPLEGQPLPGRGGAPADPDSPIRPLTRDEMLAIAYAYHPVLPDLDTLSMDEFNQLFWFSPEQLALTRVQQTSYARLKKWHELVYAVRRRIPGTYYAADRTYPRYFPAYVIVVDAPIEPGSIDERVLVVHVSYLVPYYFYYERHIRKLDGEYQRDPIRFEVTDVFSDVLAVIENEIAARFGYWRMSDEVGATFVPGVYINGFHDWEEHEPTFFDALFTPHRW